MYDLNTSKFIETFFSVLTFLLGSIGEGMSFGLVEVFTVSSVTPGVGPGVPGGAGHVGQVSIISDRHWGVVGCDQCIMAACLVWG